MELSPEHLSIFSRALGQLVRCEQTPATLLGVDPRVVNGLFAMGITARNKGRHVMADHLFQRCLLLDPYRADLWIALAASRQALGRPEEAGDMYQVAGLFTTDAAPVAYAAACFAQAGQHERARILAATVRERIADETNLAPWLAVVDANEGTDGVSCR